MTTDFLEEVVLKLSRGLQPRVEVEERGVQAKSRWCLRGYFETGSPTYVGSMHYFRLLNMNECSKHCLDCPHEGAVWGGGDRKGLPSGFRLRLYKPSGQVSESKVPRNAGKQINGNFLCPQQLPFRKGQHFP